jgi:uncharacterized protein (DUF2147 family)
LFLKWCGSVGETGVRYNKRRLMPMVQATTLKKAAIGLAASATLAVAGTAAAASNHPGNTRPGWGNGDTNHVHTGPPGQSVRVTNTNNVDVTSTSSQNSRSGNTTVSHNRSGGDAWSGNASNSSSQSASVNVSNQSRF